MRFYHATSETNLISILENGLKPGIDGVVYLAETQQDAYKFMILRTFDSRIVVIEVEIPKDTVTEQFDHSFQFFQCRAWGYAGIIPVTYPGNRMWVYENEK